MKKLVYIDPHSIIKIANKLEYLQDTDLYFLAKDIKDYNYLSNRYKNVFFLEDIKFSSVSYSNIQYKAVKIVDEVSEYLSIKTSNNNILDNNFFANFLNYNRPHLFWFLLDQIYYGQILSEFINIHKISQCIFEFTGMKYDELIYSVINIAFTKENIHILKKQDKDSITIKYVVLKKKINFSINRKFYYIIKTLILNYLIIIYKIKEFFQKIDKGQILFLASESRYLKVYYSLIKLMIEKNIKFKILIFGFKDGHKYAKRMKYPVIRLYSYYPQNFFFKYLNNYNKLEKIYSLLTEQLDQLNFTYPYLRNLLKSKLIDLIYWDYHLQKEFESALRKIILKNETKILLFRFEFLYYSYLITKICRETEIKSLALTYSSSPLIGNIQTANYKVDADIISVEGPKTYDCLIKLGYPGKSVFISGVPRFDNYKFNEEEILRIKNNLNIKNTHPSILFISIPSNQGFSNADKITMLEQVFTSFVSLNKYIKCNFIIKLHPFENGYEEYTIFNSDHVEFIFTKNIDILDLFKISDVVISYMSTAGYEAIAADKPLIQINFTLNEDDYLPLAKEGAALYARKSDELLEHLLSLLGNMEVLSKLKDGRKRYQGKYFFKLDNKASLRIFEKIISTI